MYIAISVIPDRPAVRVHMIPAHMYYDGTMRNIHAQLIRWQIESLIYLPARNLPCSPAAGVNNSAVNEAMIATFRLLRRCNSNYSSLPWKKSLTSRELTIGLARRQQNVQVAVTEDKKKLAIQCEGEEERRFHGVWLRHNCRCPICTSPNTGQTIVSPRLLVKDLKLETADIKGTP